MNKYSLAFVFIALVILQTFERSDGFLAGAGKWGAGKRSFKMERAKRSFCKRVIEYCGGMSKNLEEQHKKDTVARMEMVGNEFADYSREENYERKYMNDKIVDDVNAH